FETVRERVIIDSEGANSSRGTVLSGSSRSYTVQIYLQPKRYITATAKPGVLNAALAGVPKPARELYEKAIESVRKGENDKAVDQLKGAIALYPDFGLAYTELGMLYMKMKQPERAAEALRASLKLSPDDFTTLLTYGIALFEKKEFGEAEAHLRRALKKNNSSPSAHLYLGLALLKQRHNEEAESELKLAVSSGGDSMGLAHYYLGGLYWGKREYRRAADELETYLRLVPKAPDAERVRATIKELRGKQ
ncbi:MAG: tetratricopeptide repeat protein, partial [Pyrinomonadaceae bacterium]